MPNRMDAIIAKGTGAAKAVEARLHGLVGVFKVLSEQHGEASALLKRVKNDPDKRRELWPKIRQELLSHEKAELREVYPVLRAFDGCRELADRHDAQAGRLSAQIDRMHAMEISTETWGDELDNLIRMLKDHIREEEEEIFPAAQDVLGPERARDMEPAFLSAKKQLASGLA